MNQNNHLPRSRVVYYMSLFMSSHDTLKYHGVYVICNSMILLLYNRYTQLRSRQHVSERLSRGAEI
jgi:hypothetical protein